MKLPRILTDFMMLSTNSTDAYGVHAAIHSPNINSRCFSMGFGESMYYYPDVEQYFVHGDTRDIYCFMLNTEDETFSDMSKNMNISICPFGLKKREKRLSQLYEDVSFSDDIRNYPLTADFTIHKALSFLEDLLNEERDREFEQFFNSSVYKNQVQIVDSVHREIVDMEKDKDESGKDEDAKRAELDKRLKVEKDKLEKLRADFKPDCPLFIDRNMIFDSIMLADDDEKDNIEKAQSTLYKELLCFVVSKKFIEYVRSLERNDDDMKLATEGGLVNERGLSSRLGCLFPNWLFGKRKGHHSIEDKKPYSLGESKCKTFLEHIETIKINLKLKDEFRGFKEKVQSIERDYKNEENWCRTFKLTDHLNHYYHLINLDALKKVQKDSFGERRTLTINEWKDDKDHTINSLIAITKKNAQRYTKKIYSFINWNSPFPFVQEISTQSILPRICNQLQKMSAPLVNYNLNLERLENKVIKIMYSDRPFFEKEIKEIKEKLDNGNEISAHFSSHIASKICMIQFLPMDNDVLAHLVDLQDEESYNTLFD